MIQASDGGRVYVGRSALEIKLRETPVSSVFGDGGPTPTPIVVAQTERIVRELPAASVPVEVAPAPPTVDQHEPQGGVKLAKSTVLGLCLTAFACGIITTVTFDHQRLSELERQVRAQGEALATAARPAPAPAVEEPAAAKAPPTTTVEEPAPPKAPPTQVAAASADPVVEQLPAPEATTSADRVLDRPPAPKMAAARPTAARTPRPPRAAVRRRPAPAASAPAQPDPAAPWVDPFAQ